MKFTYTIAASKLVFPVVLVFNLNALTVGAAVAPDLQFAVDIATLNAKVVLADRINGKLKAMTKSWMAKLGQTDVDASVMTEIEKVAKNVIANVDVAGYNPTKVDVFPAGTQYRAFVLLEYSDKEASKVILNRIAIILINLSL